MRTKLIIAAVFVQLLVLGWMAGQREWILRNGPTVWLRTAPIDPRDAFRGDYVTLGYDISTIPSTAFGPALKSRLDEMYGSRSNKEIVIYSALRVNDAGLAEVTSADLTPPPGGLFIKGRVRPSYGSNSALTRVAYGIDAYYVEQGKGKEMERRAPASAPQGVQVPMEMQVALGSDGTAVLKDHRWNYLGINVDLIKQPARSNKNNSTSGVIRVTLYNASPAPVAVVLPADLRTLRLVRSTAVTDADRDVIPPRTVLPPLTDADLRVLQPNTSTSVEIDPQRPEWFVTTDTVKTPHPITEQRDYESYRIIYETPPPEALNGLLESGKVIPCRLAGRQFSPYEFGRN